LFAIETKKHVGRWFLCQKMVYNMVLLLVLDAALCSCD